MPTFEARKLRQFTAAVFRACGASAEEASIVADHLVTCNLMGMDSHGLMRIPQYVREISEKVILPGAPIRVVKDAQSLALVDCGWNFGHVGAQRAMEIAIEKARQHHVAYVLTQRCGHAGRLGAYPQFAAENGFVAFAVGRCSKAGHHVLPWGGRERRLGTNPISYSIPTDQGFPILSDFSTCAAPEGKIRVYRDQGKPIPLGWILNAQGQPTTNPADFYGPPKGAILPFGGESGYRGFALALLVEFLGGTLAGSEMTSMVPGTSVAFIVIDVEALLPKAELNRLVDQMKSYIKSSPPAEGFREVLLPGEPEFRLAQARQRDGIPLEEGTWAQICGSAQSVGVQWEAGGFAEN